MVLSTLGVAADVTPSVIETFFSHYLNRKPLRQKPTAHISYHEGLRLIRQFLSYASQHSVEDVQAFTAQWVPCPTWVILEEVLIPEPFVTKSASVIQSQLSPRGIELVGGTQWWQWRRPEIPFKAEWIEMKADLVERQAEGKKESDRIIFYVHGGAYYFGSTGEHRYQMQRHARKLRARLLAPKYRLAPQFPFPCGLHDCIAAYLYLIENHNPNTVILGGDSAGGGMVIAMLVTLRDQGIPLPAGAILLSPWVDLTHSFPSVAGEGSFDYIPANGFHHKPSMAWPPPNAADMKSLHTGAGGAATFSKTPQPTDRIDQKPHDHAELEAARGFTVKESNETRLTTADSEGTQVNSHPKPGQPLSIKLDGKVIEIQDQIQMYAANHLLAHPLVSPVMQPSLGGLPPLLIQVGGGELLHDEQVYLAHKAADPLAFPPPDTIRHDYDPDEHILNKYPPTMVQLQVWDDLCHVPHTLSFTRPAKFMYRSVAQFGAWVLAHAQSRPMTIPDDDEISVISSDSISERSVKEKIDAAEAQAGFDGTIAPRSVNTVSMRAHTITTSIGGVGRAGDPLPPFTNNMIRQRVDRHGLIYPMLPPSEIPALQIPRNGIGMIKPGPVRKWIAKKLDWDARFAKEKRQIQKTRLKEMKEGYDEFIGETPPPTALAGRRQKGMKEQKERKGKSWGMAMWSGWGSKHDEATIDRKKKLGRRPTQSIALPEAGHGIAAVHPDHDVEDVIRQQEAISPPSSTGDISTQDRDIGIATGVGVATAAGAGVLASQKQQKVEGSENTYISANSTRPHNGTIAYPFKLRNMPDAGLSTATLDSSRDHIRPMGLGRDESFMTRTGTISRGSEKASTMFGKADDGNSIESGTTHRAPGAWVDGSAAGRSKDNAEVGSHAWVIGQDHKKTELSPSQANSHPTSQTHANVGLDGEADGAHEQNPGVEGKRRPVLETFVTARESL